MYGTAERYDEALAILGDVPERMYAQAPRARASITLLRARLLFSAERVDEGIAQLELIIGAVRGWDDGGSTMTDMAGIGAAPCCPRDATRSRRLLGEVRTQPSVMAARCSGPASGADVVSRGCATLRPQEAGTS